MPAAIGVERAKQARAGQWRAMRESLIRGHRTAPARPAHQWPCPAPDRAGSRYKGALLHPQSIPEECFQPQGRERIGGLLAAARRDSATCRFVLQFHRKLTANG